jgi:ABC-2 type transport system ATP-binding protein
MIQFANVSKKFGDVAALRGVSLELRAGERLAFVGANGSGKTTLLRALVGLLQVQGRITIGGFDVAGDPERALRLVAYVPQIAPPLEAPVGELVRAAMSLRGRPESAVIERVERFGLQYDTLRPMRFRDLSGGMRQKLLAALALAAQAPVLICDEPTANLDPEARASFFAQVDELPAATLVVLCSHRLEEVRQLVGRVVEMREGQVSIDASAHALLAGLPSAHVEVTLHAEGPSATRAWLLQAGLRELGPRRFRGTFTQSAKLEIVAHLVGEHWAALEDLTVRDVDDLAMASAHATTAEA